jgi:predicted dehydrogenase
VVCEKPCTTTSEQTKELFRLAEEKGLFLMEAQKMLFLPAVKAVKDIIFSGDIGEIKMIEFSHCFSAGYNNWLFDPTMGGGTLLSSGIYAVQLLLWLCGDIKRVGGFCSKRKGLAEHQYVINGETENGVLFSIKNSTETVLDNKAVIYGSEGKIELPEYWKARKAVVYRNGKDAEMIEYPCKYELVYEALHIAECIRSGKKTSPVVTEELSVKGIEVIEKIKADWDSFIL